jgi:hypothetical protein
MRAQVLVPEFTFHWIEDFPAQVDGQEARLLFWSARENAQVGQDKEDLPAGGWLILCLKDSYGNWCVEWEHNTTGQWWGKWSDATIAIDSEPYGIGQCKDVDDFIDIVCAWFDYGYAEEEGKFRIYTDDDDNQTIVVNLDAFGVFNYNE